MATPQAAVQKTATQVSLRDWLALLAAFVVVTFAFAPALFCWPAVYRPLTKAFGWNFASANAGGSIILLLIGTLSPAVGLLADRFSPKAVILGGTITVALALALLSTIHSLGQYYALCCLLGIGVSAVSIVPSSLLLGPYFSKWRGLAVGFVNAGIGLGGFIAPRFAATQIAQRGISSMFLGLSASMAIPFLATLFLVRNVNRRITSVVRAPSSGELIRMPMFWVFGLSLFLCAHAMLGVQQNLISYLTGARMSPKDAAFVLAIALGAAAPGKLISGFLADRVSAKAGIIFSVLCVVSGIAFLLSTSAQSAALNYLVVIFGVGYGGIFNAVPTLIFERFGTNQVGKSLGLFYLFFGMGTASGGELAAHLFDRTHDWTLSFALDLALAILSLLLLLVSGRLTAISDRQT